MPEERALRAWAVVSRPLVLSRPVVGRASPRLQSWVADDNPLSLDGLHLQAELIRLLRDYGLVQQAVTVAREAVVTRYALDLGRDPLQDREAVEHELGRLASGLQDQAVRAGYTSEERHLAQLWNMLTKVRNDINHAGMRSHPETTANLHRLASELAEEAANWIARNVDQPE